MPRQPTPEVEKAITDAVIKVIREDGIVGLRVTKVARLSGTTISMLYRRYVDRNGLIENALCEFYDQRITAMAELAERMATMTPAPTIEDVVANLPGPDDPNSRANHRLLIRVPALAAENEFFRRQITETIERAYPRVRAALKTMVSRMRPEEQFDYRIIAILVFNQTWLFNDLRGSMRIGNEEYRSLLSSLMKASSPYLGEERHSPVPF